VWTWVGPRNYVLDVVRGTFEGDDIRPLSTIRNSLDAGISLHAVDQRSDWLAAEAVECHIKSFQ